MSQLCYEELFQCVEDCWERVHPGPWKRPIHSHECNSGCPMIIHRDTYVCAFSSSVHHCTNYTCDYAVVFEHERVCPITANCYPLDFKFSFEQVGHLDEQRKRDTRATSTANAKPKRDHLSLFTHAAAASADTVSVAARRRAAAAAAVPEEDTLNRVESLVGRFIKPAPALPREIRHATAVRILDLWRLMQHELVPAGLALPSNYTLQAHVFTIMMASSLNALTIGADTFYPFDQDLVGRMRDISECVVGELRCPFNAHTKWTSAVNTAMRIWYVQRVQAAKERERAKPCIFSNPKVT